MYDYGQGFDFEAVPIPDIDELSERGRGIFFIRSLMDHVEYRKTESGNVLEMKKENALNLPAPRLPGTPFLGSAGVFPGAYR